MIFLRYHIRCKRQSLLKAKINNFKNSQRKSIFKVKVYDIILKFLSFPLKGLYFPKLFSSSSDRNRKFRRIYKIFAKNNFSSIHKFEISRRKNIFQEKKGGRVHFSFFFQFYLISLPFSWLWVNLQISWTSISDRVEYFSIWEIWFFFIPSTFLLRGTPSLWVFMCRVKLHNCRNILPHSSHLNR